MATVVEEFPVSKLMAPLESARTVLVIEDDPFVRCAASEVLRNAGFDVLEAENAQRARALFRFHRPHVDAIVCDAILPDMDGTELCRQLRSEAPHVQAILTSGYQEPSPDWVH